MTKIKCLLMVFSLLLVQSCAAKGVNDLKSGTPADEKRRSTEEIKEEREAFYEKKRKELKSQNATSMADKAIREKKAYLMAIPNSKAGSLSIPGLSQPELGRLKCSTKKVEGFGDVIYGTNHLMYIKEVRRYMLEFNTRMRLHCV